MTFGADGDPTAVRLVRSGWELPARTQPDLRGRDEAAWSRVPARFGEACGTPATRRATAAPPDRPPDDPRILSTPSGGSEPRLHRDGAADPPALVCVVGSTGLRYHLRCVEDLHAMLRERGDWVLPGGADERRPVKEGSVEAWTRADDDPVGGYYGLTKGLRGRLANHVPTVLDALGLAEVEHRPRNSRMRAVRRGARGLSRGSAPRTRGAREPR